MNPDASVLVEPFSHPRLERRLRRYERVVDIMNSWDQDTQHMLKVRPASPGTDKELELGSVPAGLEEPEGFSLPLYHLQRGGKWVKWDKCYITLFQTGQMVASPEPHPRRQDKHVVNLCHLSDYDIYEPTEAEKRKVLKSKKHCYAIKTQQRSALFFKNNNYVHYFSTDNAELARQFRSSVHTWRSWYLVNRKLNLKTVQAGRLLPAQRDNYGRGCEGDPIHRAPATHNIPLSPTRAQGQPPMPAEVPVAYRQASESAFAAHGLLGNGYDQRKAQAVRTDVILRNRPDELTTTGPSNQPFTDGPGLNSRAAAAAAYPATANGRPRTASGSDKSATARPGSMGSSGRPSSAGSLSQIKPQQQHNHHQYPPRAAYPASPPARRPSTSSRAPVTRAPSTRSASRERYPQQGHNNHHQPLVDLTPTFVEPPQWSREGRGRGVRAPEGTLLVDIANGPSTARSRMESPPQKLIRRAEGPTSTLLEQQQQQQQRRRGATVTEGPASSAALAGESPFTSGGLIHRAMTMRSTGTRTGGGGAGVSNLGGAPQFQAQTQAQAQFQGRGRTRTMTGAGGEAERERLLRERGRTRTMTGGAEAARDRLLRERMRSVERGGRGMA